jgi:hypothetical protein
VPAASGLDLAPAGSSWRCVNLYPGAVAGVSQPARGAPRLVGAGPDAVGRPPRESTP